MSMAILTSEEDLRWLHEVHGLGGPGAMVEGAVLRGNEDSPDAVVLYRRVRGVLVEERFRPGEGGEGWVRETR